MPFNFALLPIVLLLRIIFPVILIGGVFIGIINSIANIKHKPPFFNMDKFLGDTILMDFGISAIISIIGITISIASTIVSLSMGIANARRLANNPKTIYGQKIDSLSMQTSAYGQPIPYAFGTIRFAGNVIWISSDTPIEVSNTAHTDSVSVGFGKKQDVYQTNYSYNAHLAILLCEGPIKKVEAIFADSKRILPSTYSNLKIRYYLGTEDQLPDPLMESFLGIGNVPAYRGRAYVVLEDFPLEDYGNRIPNFQFEVTKTTKSPDNVEQAIQNIMIIPGSGEFVYATSKVRKYSQIATSRPNPNNKKVFHEYVNYSNSEDKANALVALDQLQDILPNVNCVSISSSWFCNSTDAGNAVIEPMVEYKDKYHWGVWDIKGNPIYTWHNTSPIEWGVGVRNRGNTTEMPKDLKGDLLYGGTPSDNSIIEFLTEIRRRGLKVMFYPFLMLTEQGKPWRGRITANSTNDVVHFFRQGENDSLGTGYNNFIEHYARLVKDYIDIFIIGSEMVGLTSFTDVPNSYPAVAELKRLAARVRTIVGSSVKITYAADWSEYHHADGGWFNMDALWSDPNIDYVALDAYFPLTPDLKQSDITYGLIQEYWEKGEGWEYYYENNRQNKVMFIPSDGTSPYAWKNVYGWWATNHYNPGNNKTAWSPKMKPIIFTEYGFPSVDGCTNQPNVF